MLRPRTYIRPARPDCMSNLRNGWQKSKTSFVITLIVLAPFSIADAQTIDGKKAPLRPRRPRSLASLLRNVKCGRVVYCISSLVYPSLSPFAPTVNFRRYPSNLTYGYEEAGSDKMSDDNEHDSRAETGDSQNESDQEKQNSGPAT
jgi:hypothetical protein